MKFLGKGKAPSELPNLAIESGTSSTMQDSFPTSESIRNESNAPSPPMPIASSPSSSIAPVSSVPNNIPSLPPMPKSTSLMGESAVSNLPLPSEKKKDEEVKGEDYLEFKDDDKGPTHEEVRKQINEGLKNIDTEEKQEGFFDHFIEDINGEIKDLGKLEDWYKNKFLPQDVVSNMRSYWEDNKADVIIQNFGREYKEKINSQIKKMQELEMDWREIYFKLVKCEEEMKKEERLLKDTLSEFVDLCKRRELDGKKDKETKDKEK